MGAVAICLVGGYFAYSRSTDKEERTKVHDFSDKVCPPDAVWDTEACENADAEKERISRAHPDVSMDSSASCVPQSKLMLNPAAFPPVCDSDMILTSPSQYSG